MKTNIRRTNEVTQFQSFSIASWDADIEKMKEIGFSNEDGDEDSITIKRKAVNEFFNRKETTPKVFRTNNRRVFNPLTGMARGMRPFITYKGKQLIEIDTANSHPLLLVYELKRKNLEVENELKEIVEKGTFYDLFKKNGKSRDEIKKSVFTFFYSININTDHEVYKILNSRFPDFIKSLEQFSRGISLSELLQKIESNIWIDIVSTAAMFAGIKHATIHDSIVFAGNENVLNNVLDIIYIAFDNISPSLHVSTLDRRTLKYKRIQSNKMIPFIGKAIKYKLKFWELNRKGFYNFDPIKIINYLQSIGIYRYYTTKQDYMLIRIINHIIDTIDIPSIKHLMLQFVDEVGNSKVKQSLGYNIVKLINENSLHLLQPKEIELFKGEQDTIYTFYNDAIAKVSVASIFKIEYSSFNHYIWKSAILKRNFPNSSLLDSKQGEFEQFFNNVVKDSGNRIYTQQIFGYALQRYRKLSDMKAIVITDDNIDDQAKGGTGKGILIQALSQFLSSVKENGKSFKPDITFSYQNISHNTRLFVIDDVHQNFDITKMFSVLTDGVQIEKKFVQPYYLPPDDLPVFILTSNYGLKGSDDSHVRRRLDIGIDKHYTPKYTPAHQFGHDLFRDWEINNREWAKFDEFMLNCELMFLKDGIVEYTNPNLAIKQFKADTHEDFGDFAESFELNTEINKSDNLEKLRKLTNSPSLSKTMMTKWIINFATLRNYVFDNNRRKDTFKLTVK